jgi:hypothetical protein
MDSKGMLHIVFHAFSISNGFITDKYTNCENFGGSSEVIYIKVNPAVALNKTGTINDLLVVKEKVISTQDNIKSRAANIAYDDKNDRLHVVWFDGNNISDLDLNYLVLDTNGNPIGGFADPLPMFASVYS